MSVSLRSQEKGTYRRDLVIYPRKCVNTSKKLQRRSASSVKCNKRKQEPGVCSASYKNIGSRRFSESKSSRSSINRSVSLEVSSLSI